jgi:hypothetical protein
MNPLFYIKMANYKIDFVNNEWFVMEFGHRHGAEELRVFSVCGLIVSAQSKRYVVL